MTTALPTHPPGSSPAASSSIRLNLANLVWLAWMLALTLSFVGFTTARLDSFRPLSADEITIMAVSSKLAQQGVLGSDLHAGFFGADRHFFIDLPVQHIWQALVFRLAGIGIAQARMVSIFFTVLLLWTVGWLGRRWYDLPTSFVATFLLLVWRSDLVAIYPGLPVLGVARSARYDATVVAWVWLTLSAFTVLASRPGRWRALAVGLCAGAAALTHFVGLLVIPVAAGAALWQWRRGSLRAAHLGWMLTGLLALLLPYFVWLGLNLDDYGGQMARYGDRATVGLFDFWRQNLSTELLRYRPLVLGLERWGNPNQAYFGPTLLLVALTPVLTYLIYRLWRYRQLGDILLAASLLTFAGLLALFEQTKTPLYALLLWPGLCLAVGMSVTALLRWAIVGPGLGLARLGAVAAMIGFVVLAGWDGRQGYQTDWEQMGQVTRYRTLGNRIAAVIPSQAPVLGDYRWWWALRDHPYQGLHTVYFQARAEYAATGRLPDLAHLIGHSVRGASPGYILTNNNYAGAQYDFPAGFRQAFWDWIAACTTLATKWDDRTYGRIELYRVERSRGQCLAPSPGGS